jgi:anthranilate synthase/aminodeoxychorismate synthase-like glutamine amidotransferase
MIILIDNYDSFTYNLVQYLRELDQEVAVVRNDATSADALEALRPSALVVSPGPSDPDTAGISMEAIRRLGPHLPTLGVCLGHQCVGQVYGGHIVRAPEVVHGKLSRIRHDGREIFEGLPNPLDVVRYHSLAIDPAALPSCLEVTARATDETIMGIRHREHPIWGVQFHPESILTQGGKELLRNFLTLAAAYRAGRRQASAVAR